MWGWTLSGSTTLDASLRQIWELSLDHTALSLVEAVCMHRVPVRRQDQREVP